MFQKISLTDAQTLFSNSNLIIIDVRDHDSFSHGCIPNAIHLSVTDLQKFCDDTDKSKPILVYCYRGISSRALAQHLIEAGFREVYSLEGGFDAWKKSTAVLASQTNTPE